MTKSLRKLDAFIHGIGDVINPLGNYSAYIRPMQGDRAADARAINGAFVIVGRGLSESVDRRAIEGSDGKTHQLERKKQGQRVVGLTD